ncbi:TlyA family RNA methyltransferase [Jiella sp. MQZ9-1]|uniref:TlyA family RNA methyltransferase n=1 Tax=Jiella flava TaxID=2816857 RepID=A0A939FVC9_9HYPH|nr:TlyA family RNA methyltransferase [Jiella flava]MBO0661539.1 TlyA family RNA methyltransferase [Jiella flava]MCD2470181.1 TlyA family RNA methyltransferase [Jiella flava]
MAATISSRSRLDALLVDKGFFATRSRARDAILRGHVVVAGKPETRPGLTVRPDASIVVSDPACAYVSRAALKLRQAIAMFDVAPRGRAALDIGASTGGFTQVLLEAGVAHVVAIDVGHGQMHATIASDPRVTALEGLNARELARSDLAGHKIDLIVSDVSFISLTLALPPALSLAEPGADGLFLVKPQFEAGRAAIGKGGLLRDPASAETIAGHVREWLDRQPGWQALALIDSPISGGDGNREFLLHGRKANHCA